MIRDGLLALTILYASAVVINGDQLCEDGWRYFEDEFGSNKCFKVVKESLPWQQAQKYCQRDIAHLVNLDPLKTFVFSNISTGRQEQLTEYIFEETNGEFWSGMVVQSGRLMWDAYGPEYVLNKPTKSWIWENGQPAFQKDTFCGHVIQQKIEETSTTPSSLTGSNSFGNVLPQNHTETNMEVDAIENVVQLSLCNRTLPFVCQKPVVVPEVTETSFCPEGWLGNLYIPYCFGIVTELVTKSTASVLCQETTGGELFHVHHHSTFNLTVTGAVLQHYLLNDKHFQNETVTKIWIEGTPTQIDEELAPVRCYVITVDLDSVDERISQGVVECETKLPVMCIVPTQSAKPINIEVTSPFLDQDEVRAFKPFTQLPMTAIFDRQTNENEIIFVQTPTRYINSTNDFFQEISDISLKLGFAYNVTQSNKTVSPYEVNIWLPAAVKTKRKRRYATERLPRQAHSFMTLNGSLQELDESRKKDNIKQKDDNTIARLRMDRKKLVELLFRGLRTKDRQEVQRMLHRVKRAFPSKKPKLPDIPEIPDDIIDDILDIYDDIIEFGQAVDIDQLHLTTGYYSFGVYTLNPPAYRETEPVLLRYSERDWYIYVVMVDINTNIELLDPSNVTSFNLYRDLFFVQQILDVASAMLDVPPVFKIDGLLTFPNFIRHYEAVPEYIDGLTVKFRIYINMFSIGGVYLNFEQVMVPILIEYWTITIPPSRFVSVSVKARSTVACRRVKVDVNGTLVTFPSVRSGEISYSWERCYGVGGAVASRKCLGGYDDGTRFGSISYSTGCEPFPVLDESDSTASLKAQAEIILDGINFKDVLSSTLALTDPTLALTETDLIYVAQILSNFWEFVITVPDMLKDIYKIVNNILERIPELIDAAKRVSNIGNRIIEALEELTNNVQLSMQSSLRVVQKFLASDVRDQVGTGTLIIGLQLHNEGNNDTLDSSDLFSIEQPSDADPNITDTAIYFDESVLKDKKTRTVFQIYVRTSLFNIVYSSRYQLISKVAAASLKINGEQVTELGNDTVIAVFKLLKEDNRTVCAYWDYRADQEGGAWRTGGCNKTILPDKRISCRCNHLTNFAVLVDLEAHTISNTNKVVLKVVTKVGLCFSIVGLGLGIVTFVMFKKLRNGRGQQVLINLSVAMVCSSLIFLVGMERTENKVVCKVVAALLHYFILVTFMWMLVEGVLQYLRFVKVLGTYIPNFMVKTMIPAWGIPVIPVATISAFDYELYYGGNGYCWLARDAMLYGFVIPVAVILCANVGMFCLVFYNLLRRKSRKMASNQSGRKTAILHLQAAVSIFVILGLTWVFGFLAIDGARVTFHYVFAVLNAFQGFFIFLLFTAREKQIVDTWKRMCCKAPVKKIAVSSDSAKDSRTRTKTETSFIAKKSNNGVNGNVSRGKCQDGPDFTDIDKASR